MTAANVLTEPNYTQVPNLLFDHMADMGEAELRCTLAIVRKIIGYHKDKPEPVSYSQLETLTGMSRPAVVKGIEASIIRGWIKVAGQGKRGVNLYTLNFNDQLTKLTSDGEKGTVRQPVNKVDQLTTITSTSKRTLPVLVNEVNTQKKVLKETSKEKEIHEPEETPVHGAPQSDQTVSDVVDEPPVSTPAPKARKPRPRDLWIDTIAECVFKVKPGATLGKRTGPRCGTIKSEILTTYPDMTPEKFRLIIAWKSPYISEDGPKLIKMIGEYEDQQKITRPLAPATVTHPDPHCARCGGVGYLLPPVQPGDPDYGQHIPCSACLEKERQNGQRAQLAS
jgi:hypothetical protein